MKPATNRRTTRVLAALLIGLIVLIAASMAMDPCRPCSAGKAREAATRCMLEETAGALATFTTAQAQLPATLQALTTGSSNRPALLGSACLVDAWGNPIQYTTTGGLGFELRSAGPDGRMGTRDDMIERTRLRKP